MSITLLFFFSLYLFSLSPSLSISSPLAQTPSSTQHIRCIPCMLYTLLENMLLFAAANIAHTPCGTPRSREIKVKLIFPIPQLATRLMTALIALKLVRFSNQVQSITARRKKSATAANALNATNKKKKLFATMCCLLPVACRHWQPVHIDYPVPLPPSPPPTLPTAH